jgi:hypothetical protein
MYFESMTASDSREQGACRHFQPSDLVDLAEKQLRGAGIPESDWEGKRFHWGGDIDSPPFRSLVLCCVRRNGNWVMTRLDRRKEPIGSEDKGFWEMLPH